MTQRSISDFKQESDSISLAKLKEEPFTIVALEDSNYEENGVVNPGLKITMGEPHMIDGKSYTKIHTTRIAIVNKLKNPQILAALKSGDVIGPVKSVQVPSKKGGKPYFDLVEA